MNEVVKRKKSGFTLVELIVTMALFVIIIGFIFGFYLFNYNAFVKGEALSRVQFDVRMASDQITTGLRNASVISQNNNTLTYHINLSYIQVSFPRVDSVVFQVELDNSRYYVSYTIHGDDQNNENPYELKSRVLLNNITSFSEALDTDSSAIYYNKIE